MNVFTSMTDLTQEVFRLHSEQRYAEALEMLARVQINFPEQQGRIYYWRMCFAALTGDIDQSLSLFAQSLDHGYWHPSTMLRQDSDLKTLQDNPLFEQLFERNAQFVVQAQANVKPHRIDLFPETPPPYPLFVALHSNTSNAAAHVDYWRSAIQQGWAVSLPQSTQVAGVDSYVWDNMDWTQREVTEHIDAVCQMHPIDRGKLVIGGFSKGAQVAARLVLSGMVQACGFISVAGYDRPEQRDQWQAELASARARDVRAFLVVGESDLMFLPGIKALHDLLTGRDIRSELRIFPSLDHAYPEAWDHVLPKALEFATHQT